MTEESINRRRLPGQLPAAIRRYVWSSRVGDFAILATIPVLGFAYGIDRITLADIFKGLELLAISLLLLVHIFALNDWSDFHLDARARPVARFEETGRESLLLVSVVALACFVSLLWSMRPAALLPAALVLAASAIYSPRGWVRGKEVVFLSSALHAICAVGCFLVGLAVATGLSTRWGDIWSFLGLSIAAGHINQEISDHVEDLASRARTHSTVLGPKKAFILGQLTFAAAFLSLLLWPSGTGWGLKALAVVAWAANLVLAVRCWRDQVSPESVERYRSRYRRLYGLIGLGLLWHAPALQQLLGL